MIRLIRCFLAVSTLMSMIACGSAQNIGSDNDATAEVTFTMVQYNVGVFSKYADSSISAVVSAIKEMGADVVTLNELDSCATRTGKVYQLKSFAEAMGNWKYHYASAMPFQGGAYGVGIASRPEWKIVRTDKVILPKYDGREPRALAVVEYEDFVICATHLDLTEQAQLGQVASINDYINTHYSDYRKPIFLGGDFNCLPDSQPITNLRQSWALLTPKSETYPSTDPKKSIDFIFVKKNGNIVNVEQTSVPQALNTVNLATASDHLPVVLTVKINR